MNITRSFVIFIPSYRACILSNCAFPSRFCVCPIVILFLRCCVYRVNRNATGFLYQQFGETPETFYILFVLLFYCILYIFICSNDMFWPFDTKLSIWIEISLQSVWISCLFDCSVFHLYYTIVMFHSIDVPKIYKILMKIIVRYHQKKMPWNQNICRYNIRITAVVLLTPAIVTCPSFCLFMQKGEIK